LFLKMFNSALHSAGRFVPQLLNVIAKQKIPNNVEGVFDALREYEGLVIRQLVLSSKSDVESKTELEAIQIKLSELTPRLKEIGAG